MNFIKDKLKSFFYVMAFPFVLSVFFLFNLFRPLKVAILMTGRMGHMALNTELFCRRRKLGLQDKNQITIFITENRVANTHLLKMWKRTLVVIDNVFLRSILYTLVKFNSRYVETLPCESNEYYEFNNASLALSFTNDEITQGEIILEKMGLTKSDWFICIFARDSAYLPTIQNSDWSYHNVRDMDIDDYIDAVKYIIDRGGWVIRLGKVVAKEMNYKHTRFIDYPFSEFRSDFMDLYIQYRSRFVLTNPSGGTDISTILDIPYCGVNIFPIDYSYIGKKGIYITKKLKRKVNGEWVSLNDYFDLLYKKDLSDKDKYCYFQSEFFNQEGFEIVNNTPEEILNLTKEMLERVDGRYMETKQDQELQRKYNELRLRSFQFSKSKSPVGIDFLKKNPWLLS